MNKLKSNPPKTPLAGKKEFVIPGVGSLDTVPAKVDKAVLGLISEEVARKYQMAAFEKNAEVLKVAMINPQDIEAQNILHFIAVKDKLELEIYKVSPEIFSEIVSRYSTTERAVEDVMKSLKEEEIEIPRGRRRARDQVAEALQEAPVSKLVQVIIDHAVEGKASDVHIEPTDEGFRVRFRMDGILHSSLFLPKDVGRVVISRVKILSNLKIDETRKPQDGRFKIEKDGRIIDFRVASFPVIEGEKVVLRVLDREQGLSDFKSLGLVGSNHDILREEIKNPYGIILLTGPTGSGKTTTLYAFLQALNKEERNIVTLEDPVEYYIEGVNQSQIKPEIGYTFANGLRSILRQDPNIIMVGEIRDNETAELAIHAALTGHLVFSTLHTNDSVGAVPRLIDMGIEPFLLAASLNVVVAQRLVRRVCGNCKKEADIPLKVKEKVREEIAHIPKEELEKYGIDPSRGFKFYEGAGCGECNNLGLKGRIAIFEVFKINDQFREIISNTKGAEAEIRQEIKKQKMMTMRQDGILKVLAGITTLSEVERVTAGSQTVGGDLTDDYG